MNRILNKCGLQVSYGDVVKLVLGVPAAIVISFYSAKWLMNRFDMDPTRKSKRQSRFRAEKILKRLEDESGFKIKPSDFSDHELVIATQLVVPSDIPISWNDIAGLDGIIQELRESIILPVRHKELFKQSRLWQPPKGVLLHGPPGCGKTLIAKATAKEAGMRFINLDISNICGMWYGESQKLAAAVFSLAKKIQPCIIFIDEMDSFLGRRSQKDHEATAMVKTLFMMHWDGLCTNNNAVIVMGATNRPDVLDSAIIRRMPVQFFIGLPTESQRLEIIQLILGSERTDESVDISRLSKLTDGFSGSDLHEMCRNAAVYRMRQFMRSNETVLNGSSGSSSSQNLLPPIYMDDLLKSFERVNGAKMRTKLK